MKILFLFFCLPLVSVAQNSIIQDNSGETSLFFGKYKSVQFSSGDASIAANISSYKSDSQGERFWGLSFKAKSNEGVSKLLDGYQFKPKFEMGAFIGRYFPARSVSTSTYWYGSGNVSNSYFKLLEKTLTNSFKNESLFGWRGKAGINQLSHIGNNPTLGGISLELGRFNNLDDLTSVDRYETVYNTAVSPNTATLFNKTSGFSGDYKTGNQVRLNIDYIVFPHFISQQFGIGGFFRGSAGTSFSRQNIGFGIFLGQKGAPDKIVLGLVYQVNDIFNQISDEPNFQKRTGLSLNAGYNF